MFDKANFKISWCARRSQRVKELHEAGCEMRLLIPRAGSYACMHAKTWIIDKEVVLTSSVNLSHNGLENNQEYLRHLLRNSEVRTVGQLVEDFGTTWAHAVPGTKEHPREIQAKRDKADKKKQLARSQSAPLEDAQE